MPQSAAPSHRPALTGFEAAADQAIAACGGDVRAALKAKIVANEFLESEALRIGAGRFIRLRARKVQDL
jgi:hypothetical protein